MIWLHICLRVNSNIVGDTNLFSHFSTNIYISLSLPVSPYIIYIYMLYIAAVSTKLPSKFWQHLQGNPELIKHTLSILLSIHT